MIFNRIDIGIARAWIAICAIGWGGVLAGCDPGIATNIDNASDIHSDVHSDGILSAPGIRKLIEGAEYHCPAVVQLTSRDTLSGLQFEIWCGPDNGSGKPYPNLHFMVYPEKAKVTLCQEFSPAGSACM